jgi:hypothetical protein
MKVVNLSEYLLNKVDAIHIKIHNFIFPPYKPNEKEQLLLEIFSLLLYSRWHETECITAPVSGIYYVTNEKLGYWAKVSDDSITLTNHKFSFNHQGNFKFQKMIIEMIQEFMEIDRAQFESTVFQNEVEMLKEIKEKVLYG